MNDEKWFLIYTNYIYITCYYLKLQSLRLNYWWSCYFSQFRKLKKIINIQYDK